MKSIKKTFDIFKPMKINKEASVEFKANLIYENSRRFLVLLSLVIISQIIFIIFELTGEEWNNAVFICRILITCACAIFILLISVIGKNAKSKNSVTTLGIITSVIQLISVLIGCYFVVYMFRDGIYSYSSFLLVSFIVSLTCIRNPYYSGVFLFIIFIGLTIYLGFFVTHISIWLGEFLIGLVIVFLFYFGNILNYNRHLKIFMQDKEILRQNEKLKTLSQTDELTGIFNRREIYEHIEKHICMAKRYKTCFCVAILDIDHFKRVNDNYGHNVGDDVLKQFSKNIKSMLRNTDVFGRWGGEEFIIIIPNCEELNAYQLVERLRKTVKQYNFTTVGQITFSAGISEYTDENNASELVGKADNALYEAKESGRNQTQIYIKTSFGCRATKTE